MSAIVGIWCDRCGVETVRVFSGATFPARAREDAKSYGWAAAHMEIAKKGMPRYVRIFDLCPQCAADLDVDS